MLEFSVIFSLILREDLVSFLAFSVFSLLPKLGMWINLSCNEVKLEMKKEKLKLKKTKERTGYLTYYNVKIGHDKKKRGAT